MLVRIHLLVTRPSAGTASTTVAKDSSPGISTSTSQSSDNDSNRGLLQVVIRFVYFFLVMICMPYSHIFLLQKELAERATLCEMFVNREASIQVRFHIPDSKSVTQNVFSSNLPKVIFKTVGFFG